MIISYFITSIPRKKFQIRIIDFNEVHIILIYIFLYSKLFFRNVIRVQFENKECQWMLYTGMANHWHH
jgi:hypothetical protein